jgi:hypothetical protein
MLQGILEMMHIVPPCHVLEERLTRRKYSLAFEPALFFSDQVERFKFITMRLGSTAMRYFRVTAPVAGAAAVSAGFLRSINLNNLCFAGDSETDPETGPN